MTTTPTVQHQPLHTIICATGLAERIGTDGNGWLPPSVPPSSPRQHNRPPGVAKAAAKAGTDGTDVFHLMVMVGRSKRVVLGKYKYATSSVRAGAQPLPLCGEHDTDRTDVAGHPFH